MSAEYCSRVALFDSFRDNPSAKSSLLQDFLRGLLLFMRIISGGQNGGEDIRKIMILDVIS